MQPFVDYYETLQVSPNADLDAIHRIYRILAQRLHPDNVETGDEDAFRELCDAYRILSDPQQRAAFDVEHREVRRMTWKIFDQTSASQGVEGERRKRAGVLSLLYRRRVAQPQQPSLSLNDFEDVLGVPKEHLEFALWYLKDGGYIAAAEPGRFAITRTGVDLAETIAEPRVEPLKLSTRVA